jgi:hypothetical protein
MMAGLGFLMLLIVIPMQLALLLLALLPIGVILFIVFSIMGILIFLIIEYFVNKNLKFILQKIIPHKEETANMIQKMITFLLRIIKIPVSVFAYMLLIGFLALYKEITISILQPLLMLLLVQVVIFILLKITHKKTNVLTNLFFLIEPYILLLVILGIAWSKQYIV